MLKRLKIKFVAVIMVIVTVMLCLIFGMVYFFTKSNMESESTRMMQAIAGRPIQPGRPDRPPEEVRLPFFVIQIGRDGRIIAEGGGYYDLSDEDFVKSLTDAVSAREGQTGVIEEYRLRFCRTVTPMGQSIVFADMSNELATLSSLIRTCVFIGILCLAVFFSISIALAVWMVRPVDEAWRQQRRFVADASHELKTPLTVIISNAELLQLPEYDEESKACFSSRILTMSRQMRGLVERLLELAGADHEQRQTAHIRLNFSELAEYAALPFEPLFFEKSLELAAELQGDIFVDGDSQQLQQVIDILLDNAQKYAAAPDRVAFTLNQRDKRHCLLSVSNACEPMEKEELQNLFKRFYRMDKARSRDGSFGLGLSIAESIVAAHHGRIWAEWQGGRVTFFVELPVREPRGHPSTAKPRRSCGDAVR